MIGLAAPIGLAALLALALPILVHLIRRAEEREVQFAALRWISERAGPATRWRLHEPVLLALRLLLLAAIALLLALPFRRERAEPGVPWVAVAPGVNATSARAVVDAPAAEWRGLAPGFPRVDDAASQPLVLGGESRERRAGLASLVRQLDAELPDTTELTVVVPRELGGLDGERLRLGRAVDWRVVDGSSPRSVAPAADSTLRIAVRAGADGADETAVVDALSTAWRTAGLTVSVDAAPADAPIPSDVDWLFALGGAPAASVDAWVREGGLALVSRQANVDGVILMSDANGDALLRERALGRGRMLTTPAALTVDAMPALLAPDFPERLHELLSAKAAAPDRASASAMTPGRRDVGTPGTVRALDGALAVLAALLFLAERLWATRRRGAARAATGRGGAGRR